MMCVYVCVGSVVTVVNDINVPFWSLLVLVFALGRRGWDDDDEGSKREGGRSAHLTPCLTSSHSTHTQ